MKRRASILKYALARASASCCVQGTPCATDSLRSPNLDRRMLAPLSVEPSSPPRSLSVAAYLTADLEETSQPLAVTLVRCPARSASTLNSVSSLRHPSFTAEDDCRSLRALAFSFALPLLTLIHSSASMARARSRRKARSLWLSCA